MKIVVVRDGKSKQLYIINVIDGDNIIHTEAARGLKNRDEIVWKLADLYQALDIELKMDEEKEQDFKFSEIPSIPVLEEDEAEEFFEDNQDMVYSRIIQAVEEGVRADRKMIRLFELNGTGEYFTSHKDDWAEGLTKAIEYYASQENYEKCIIAKQLIAKLK